MQLRDYQQQIIDNLRKVLINYNSPVVVLGCGGGKSVICAEISKLATDKGNRVLFLVHRIELIEQIKNTFIKHGVNMELCDISMVQAGCKLNKEYKLIITDESHHSTCKTYKKIYNKYPNAKRVNVTATPCRTDGRGLEETCDYLLETVSTKWLIKNKYLSPYEYYSVTLDGIDWDAIKKVRGEYEDITELLDKPVIYGDVFKHYKNGSKAICYCSSVKHSIDTATEFCNRGIPAKHIDGKTPKEERKQIIEDFKNGKILVLCNYSLIAEGFDVPDCDTVMLLRKTASLNLFIQMAMRCMRYKENKTAYIYDFCGNIYEHGFPDMEREWSLSGKVKKHREINEFGEYSIRTCQNCFRAFKTAKECPYCHELYIVKPREIAEQENIRLARITAEEMAKMELEKKKKRMEVGRARTLEELIKIGKERGYKNPVYWAKMIINSRDRNKPAYKKFGG